jgi:hypothetical protein
LTCHSKICLDGSYVPRPPQKKKKFPPPDKPLFTLTHILCRSICPLVQIFYPFNFLFLPFHSHFCHLLFRSSPPGHLRI